MSFPTIGELATTRPLSVRVFQRHRIDFCCGGGKPLDEVCRTRGLDANALLREVEVEESRSTAPGRRWDEVAVADVVQHLIERYHRPLDEELPRIAFLAGKVARVHGDKDARLAEIAATYAELQAELEQHMAKEEEILFPMMLRQDPRASGPIEVMEDEHVAVGDLLRKLRELTGDYVVPAEACRSWTALWQGLEALEADLHEHIHLENNVLFRRA